MEHRSFLDAPEAPAVVRLHKEPAPSRKIRQDYQRSPFRGCEGSASYLRAEVPSYGVLPELLPIDTGVVHVHVQYCSCSCRATCAFVRSCGNTSFVPYCRPYTYCTVALTRCTKVLSKV